MLEHPDTPESVIHPTQRLAFGEEARPAVGALADPAVNPRTPSTRSSSWKPCPSASRITSTRARYFSGVTVTPQAARDRLRDHLEHTYGEAADTATAQFANSFG